MIREISIYGKNADYPSIRIDGKPFQIHVLVAELHVPKPTEYNESYIVHHIDHDKRNARAANLAWISRPDNATAAHDAGQYDNTKSKRKAIAIDGEDFESIHAAARTKLFGSRKTIRGRLNDPTNTSYVFRD